MAVGSNSDMKLAEQKGKIGGSDGGNKTCHQCRHKARGFVASCKKKKDRPCTTSYCQNCLSNRYGENAEHMAVLEDWHCPKCRGICNCSCCRKKEGHQPTGILVHTAKATGFSSVSELLLVKGPGNYGIDRPPKIAASDNEPTVFLPKKRGRENSSGEEIQDSKHSKNKTNAMKFQNEDIYASIPLPQGTELTIVAGIELPLEEVGHALQFLEFCAAFGGASKLYFF